MFPSYGSAIVVNVTKAARTELPETVLSRPAAASPARLEGQITSLLELVATLCSLVVGVALPTVLPAPGASATSMRQQPLGVHRK
jgi:hypothetical protein